MGPWAIWDIGMKRILNPNIVKYRFPTTYFAITPAVWHFVQRQSTVLPMSCSVQDSKAIGRLKRMLSANEVSRNFGLKWVKDGLPILQSPHWQVSSSYNILATIPSSTHIEHNYRLFISFRDYAIIFLISNLFNSAECTSVISWRSLQYFQINRQCW